MEKAVSRNVRLSTCWRQNGRSVSVQPFRCGIARSPSLSRRLKERRASSARSADVQTLTSPQHEETQVSGSLWDDGKTLVIAIPMPEPQIAEETLQQPFVEPFEPKKVDEPQQEVSRRPGLLRKVWRAYIRALDERPILVKSATSFFGFLMGDLLAQGLAGRGFDVFRCLRLLAFGVTMDGPVGHVWYNFLDKNIMPKEPTSNKAVVLKMLADQLLWAPFFSCIFFAFTNTLAGHPEATIPAIQNKLIPMMLANFAVWPIAHLINFKFIPSQQRILYINCIQVAWSAYLSNLSAARVRTST